MNKTDFKQSMSHDDAMAKGKTLDNMSLMKHLSLLTMEILKILLITIIIYQVDQIGMGI